MREPDYREITETNGSRKNRIPIVCAVVVLVGIIFFFSYFYVDTVEVMGSGYYSSEEIQKMVLKGPLAKNSILAPVLYSKDNIEDIPFIEAVHVTRANNHSIIISVKETALVGCIKYLDCYMYFDRQGVIVASSVDRNMRVPFFAGMEIENVAFGDELPFADESLLNTSISLSRIFAKNNEIPDYIVFDSEENITLHYGDIVAQLGPDKYLEDKMTRMLAILPKISGQKGILHLENINNNRKTVTFEKEMTPEELKAQQNSDGEEDADEEWDSGYDSSEEEDSGYDSSEEEEEDSYDSSEEEDDGYDSSEEEDSGYDSSAEE